MNNEHIFNDYDYNEQPVGYESRNSQLEAQGVDTDIDLTFGKGYAPSTPTPKGSDIPTIDVYSLLKDCEGEPVEITKELAESIIDNLECFLQQPFVYETPEIKFVRIKTGVTPFAVPYPWNYEEPNILVLCSFGTRLYPNNNSIGVEVEYKLFIDNNESKYYICYNNELVPDLTPEQSS